MKPYIRKILVIVLILTVLGYTIYNFYSGRSDLPVFVVSLAFLSYLLVSMVAGLVDDLRSNQ